MHKNDRNFDVACFSTDCSQRFSTFGGFNSHIYRHHRENHGISDSPLDSGHCNGYVSENEGDDQIPLLCDRNNYYEGDLEEDDNIRYDMWHLLGISDDEQKRSAATFLLKLREVCRVSEKSVLEIMEGTNSLFGQAFLMSKAAISDSLGHAGIDTSSFSEFRSAQLQNPFKGLETIYKQDKYFKQHFKYVVRKL